MSEKKTLEQLREELENKAAVVVTAMVQGTSEEEMKDFKKSAKNALDAYNAKAAEDAYMTWAAEGNAVLKAITNLYVPKALRLSYARDKKTGVPKYRLTDGDIKIDLVHMEETIGAEHFAREDWFVAIQKMVFVLAGNLDTELGHNPDFQYQLSESARVFEFAKDANPASKKSVVKALQYVTDSILFIPLLDENGEEVRDKNGEVCNAIKVLNKHYAYVRECLTRQGKNPGEVLFGGTSKMTELVSDIMHCILTGKAVKLIGE